MNTNSNFYFALFIYLILFLLAVSCNPSSTAYFVYEGRNYDQRKPSTVVLGRILDKKTNEPLVGANVSLNDYRLGAATDIYGNYFIEDIPPGIYKIQAAFIGYKAHSISNVILDSNKIYLIDFKLLNDPIIVE